MIENRIQNNFRISLAQKNMIGFVYPGVRIQEALTYLILDTYDDLKILGWDKLLVDLFRNRAVKDKSCVQKDASVTVRLYPNVQRKWDKVVEELGLDASIIIRQALQRRINLVLLESGREDVIIKRLDGEV